MIHISHTHTQHNDTHTTILRIYNTMIHISGHTVNTHIIIHTSIIVYELDTPIILSILIHT